MLKLYTVLAIQCIIILGLTCTDAALKKECMEGPSYWCASLENARSCKVEQYCHAVVWKEKEPADTCSTCKEYVGMVSSLIANKDTQAEILSALKSACSLLPSDYQGVCSELVTAYGQQIMDTIVNYLKDPTVLCKQIGLCGSRKPSKAALVFLKNAPKIQAGADTCSTCKQYAGTAYLIVSNKETQSEILDLLKSECSSLPSFARGMCTELVSAYGQQLMDQAVAYLKDPNNLCTKLGLCSGTVKPFFSKVNSDYCTMCKQYVGTAYMLLMNKQAQAEVLAEMKSACSLLPTSAQGACTELVTAFGQQIIDSLVAYLKDPSQLCTTLGICSATKLKATDYVIQTSAPKDNCATCKQYVGTVYLLVSNPSTQAEIISAVKSACSLLPELYKPICTEAVAAYGQQAIDQVVAYLKDPSKLCTTLGLCNGTPNKLVLKLLEEAAKIKAPQDNCDTCKQYEAMVYQLVSNPATQAEILSAVKSACSLLPSEYQGVCTELVAAYGQQVIDAACGYLKDPVQVCTALGLCSSKTKGIRMINPFIPLKKSKVNSDYCTMCKQYAGTIYMLASNKATQAEILSAMNSACSLLPASEKGICSELVAAYGQRLIDTAVAYLKDPSKICSLVGLCSGRMLIGMPIETKAPRDTCGTCKQYEAMVYQLVSNPDTQAEILSAIKSACSLLPSEYQGICSELVSAYGQQVIDAACGYLKDPVQVCTFLGLCTGREKPILIAPIRVSPKVGQSTPCLICEFIADEALKEIKANSAAILAEAKSLCGKLPEGGAECTVLVTLYGQKAIDAISKLEPATLCTGIKLCKAKKVRAVKVDSFQCDVCMLAMGKVDDLIKEDSSKIEDLLDKVCDLLPAAYKSECDSLIKTYGPTIVEFLVKELDPKGVCVLLKLCSAQKYFLHKYMLLDQKKSVAPVKETFQCELCMLVMENLQKILGSKTTEDDVKKALDKVCAVLPSSVATECESLVNQYADQIVEIIAQELDPKSVCVLIKLCDASKYFDALKKKAQSPVPAKKVGDSIECTICTTAISYLASTLKENETRQELKDELKQICEYLPTGYQAQCDTMIDTYTDQIIDLLIDQFQPHEVCTEIGLCEAKYVTKTIHNPNPFASSVSCKSSEFMMGYLAQRLHGVKLGETMPAKDQLNWIMAAMCVQLPKGKEECNTLVKKYGSKIQALIVDHHLKPNVISKHLGLCTLGDTQKMKYISYSNYKLGMMRPKSISCTVCQYAMGYVVSALKTEKTEQVIANKFKTLVCEKLPEKALVNECGALIDNYGSELVDLLIKKLDGLTLCEALDICT